MPYSIHQLTVLSSGIGAAVAKAFATAGCERIAITDLNPTSLEQTREAILAAHPHTRVLTQAGNIAEEQFVETFFDAVVSEFGRVDYAVNSAGILGKGQRSSETSTEAFDQINNVNYRGCWLCSRAQLKQMTKQDPLPSHDLTRPSQRGTIVNIASQLGIVGRPRARKSFSLSLYVDPV